MSLLSLIPYVGPILSELGGAGTGQSKERYLQNKFIEDANQRALQAAMAGSTEATSRYGTQQGATTNALANQSQEATSRYGTQQGATTSALNSQSDEGLKRAQLALTAPSVRARQSILGSLMANGQPLSFTPVGGVAGHVPQISGGLSVANLTPEARQQGMALVQQALQAQLTGSDVPAATDFMGGVLKAPAATDFMSGILAAPGATDFTKGQQPYKTAGKGESILSSLGVVGAMIDALRKQQPTGESSKPPFVME